MLVYQLLTLFLVRTDEARDVIRCVKIPARISRLPNFLQFRINAVPLGIVAIFVSSPVVLVRGRGCRREVPRLSSRTRSARSRSFQTRPDHGSHGKILGTTRPPTSSISPAVVMKPLLKADRAAGEGGAVPLRSRAAAPEITPGDKGRPAAATQPSRRGRATMSRWQIQALDRLPGDHRAAGAAPQLSVRDDGGAVLGVSVRSAEGSDADTLDRRPDRSAA